MAAAVGDADIACILLRFRATADDNLIRAAAARVSAIVRTHDIALLLDGRADLVRQSGSDGVHLARVEDYAAARRLIADGIVGVGSASRHDAMLAGEQGADYVAFGDFDDAAPTAATIALAEWWGEAMTVPCVAGGCAQADHAAVLAKAGADFVAVGGVAWANPAGLATLLCDIAAAAESAVR